MHTYRVVLQGTSFVVYYDSAPKLTGSTFFNGTVFDSPAIYWGDGGAFTFGVSQWEYFETNASALNCAVVPGARGVSILIIGGLLVLHGAYVVARRSRAIAA